MSEHEWSSMQLADLVGVSVVTLHRWHHDHGLVPSIRPGGEGAGRGKERVWSDDDACWTVVLGEHAADRNRQLGRGASPSIMEAPRLWRPYSFPPYGWFMIHNTTVQWSPEPVVSGGGLVWLVDCARTWATVRAGHRDDTHARELST